MTGSKSVSLGVVWLLLSNAMGACKTTSTDDSSKSSDLASRLQEESSAEDTWLSRLNISESASKALYLQMLGSELYGGEGAPKDQSHTIQGLVICKKNVERDACSLFVRKEDEAIRSLEQSIEAKISHEISEFGRKARQDIPSDQPLVIDLVCQYLGKNSPPFGTERADCEMLYPRGSDEIIFSDRSAEAIVESLRGHATLGDGKVTVKGMLLCRLGDLAIRTACFSRAFDMKEKREKIVELSVDDGLAVTRLLRRSLTDRKIFTLSSVSTEDKVPELKADLECRVDSTHFEDEGSRHYECLAHL